MRVLVNAVAIVLLLGVAGCGSSKPAAKAPPATPEQAVAEVSKSLSQNKPEVLWQSLPPSYQADVKDVIQTFAGTCDPELYNQSFAISQKLVKVLQTKKDLILTHPLMRQSGVDSQKLAQNWDAVVNVVAPLVNSEVSDLDKLKALDVEKFLSVSGAQFMQSLQALSKLAPNSKTDMSTTLAGVKATQVKTEGDTVTVKIEYPGETPREERFVKVEERWIPKTMANDWKANIARAKTELQKATASNANQNKAMTLSQIKMLDGVLDQMLAAKTAQEFNNSLQSAMMAVMGLAAPVMQQMRVQ